mmetsp:Transcript_59654/g.122352  ORF Transcript_59654/g.122352 Transcript_59654/m.122352 type:complete len:464 (-) Transcript_59654:233-1624(-)
MSATSYLRVASSYPGCTSTRSMSNCSWQALPSRAVVSPMSACTPIVTTSLRTMSSSSPNTQCAAVMTHSGWMRDPVQYTPDRAPESPSLSFARRRRRAPEPEPEPEPVRTKKKEAPVQRAAAPVRAPPPEPKPREIQYQEELIPVKRYNLVPDDKELPRYNVVWNEVVYDTEVPKEVIKYYTKEVPMEVEKYLQHDVPVPVEVPVVRNVERDVIREVPVDKHVTKEVAVAVEKVVTREIPVPVDKVVERIVYKEVPVDKIITREVPVEVEKIVYREVQVPVEKIVDKIVEVPVEKIVYQDRIVYQDKIVYQDRTVEVPVERCVYGRDIPQQYDTGMMYGSYREPVQSRRIGLGLVLRRSEDGMTYVKEIVPGYAAQRQGGLMAGDQLLAVDGKGVENWELEDIKHLTTGEVGSQVVLNIRRDGRDMQVQLERTLENMGVSGMSDNFRGLGLETTAPLRSSGVY